MSSSLHTDKILILDFGSQYTQLIARRIREVGVYCEIHSFKLSPEAIRAFEPKGIILSGGPETVTSTETPRAPDIVFQLGCPVLGICYGMQTMALQLGGEVEIAEHHEFGHAPLKHWGNSALFKQLTDEPNDFILNVWMSHGDRVVTLPPDFECIGSTENTPIAAMASTKAPFYAIQCHPEVTHTPQGKEIFKQFAINICQCQTIWNPTQIIENLEKNIREKVGKEQVLLALSGGTDSSVLAALLQRAIGNQCICLFVDTGLLRHQEADNLILHLREHLKINIHVIEAKDIFLGRLKGIADPEQKRKIIGKTFIEIFEKEALKFDNVRWLAQGTIYPDVIESAGAGGSTGQTHVIKSHHNVGGLPETMQLKLLEPFRELFKDEVRQIGTQLGLPKAFVHRHPFPGPGLAVRILGEIQEDFIHMVRQADTIFLEELQKAGYYEKVNQAFAVFLPVKSVGVKGDARKYDYVIALRAVETVDFMTAQWAALPHELLAKTSNRIMNEVNGISRVVYDISSKPPATIEWE